MMNEAGIQYEFLPPYSPDYNPIEESFAALKAWMRKRCLWAEEYIRDNNFEGFLQLALLEFTAGLNPGAHFRSCGYF